MHVPHNALQSTTALLYKRQRVKDRVRPVRHARPTRITPRVRALVPFRFTTDDLRQVELRSLYAEALFKDPAATRDDCSEAVTTLEDTDRIARRVFGGAHPTTAGIERHLRNARAMLSIHEHAPTCVAIFAAAALAIAAVLVLRKKLT